MNSNWVIADAYSDNNYPNGRGVHGGWMWVSGDAFGPVPAGGSIRVNNGGSGTPRWPEMDWCVPAGTHRVMMSIDRDNDVPETNNGDNNTAWTSFVVNNRTLPAPDLTATRTASAIGPFIAGQTAVLPFVFQILVPLYRHRHYEHGRKWTTLIMEVALIVSILTGRSSGLDNHVLKILTGTML
jgi:hypothetical protein